LTKSNHLSVWIDGDEFRLSQIPNIHLASFGDRGECNINIFFPKLIEKKRNFYVNVVAASNLEAFFDTIVRPSLVRAAKEQNHFLFENSIPFSYSSFAAACNTGGHFNFAGLTVPAAVASSWIKHLRLHSVATIFEDLFFMVFSKGLKIVIDPQNSIEEINNTLNFYLKLALVYPHQCYFDVASTFYTSQPSASVFMSKQGVDDFLTNENYTRTEIDNIALLEDLRGFRSPLKKRFSRSSGIHYVQLYSTEKAALNRGNQTAFVAMFDLADVVANTGKYRNAKQIMKTVLPLMSNSAYGLRWEMRVGYLALLRLVDQQFKPLMEYITPADCIVIPTFHLSLFKIFHLSAFSQIIAKLTGESHNSLLTRPNEYRTIAVVTAFIKGLASRLDDSSWYRQIYKAIELSEVMKACGKAAIAKEYFDEESLCIAVDERHMKIDDIMKSATGGSNCVRVPRMKKFSDPLDVVRYVVEQANIEIWAHVRKWNSINIGPTSLVPEECKESLSEVNLTKYQVAYVLVTSAIPWNQRVRQMFNVEGRRLNEKYMQNWASLGFGKLFQNYSIGLSQESAKLLVEQLISYYESNSELLLPGFETYGKFYVARKIKGQQSMRFFVRKRN